ncbi:asparagine synthase-related protein, partial [Erythrobacter sp.]|uniref:asparagine synthase-related protein n=1 Tax=Erythrobacter sp. TaxID=1042 RepID=UPI00311E121C
YLPQDILYRPKQGFVTPIAQWFRGPLASEARAVASSELLTGSGWFDRKALSRLAENHIAGRSDNARTLWQLLMLERSLRHLRPSG